MKRAHLLLALTASTFLFAAGAAAQCMSFGTPSTLSLINTTSGVFLADLDRDGTLDLIATTGNAISICLGTGTGTFATPTALALGGTPAYVAVGDLNNDGKLDLVVSNSASNFFTVHIGIGNGTFVSPVTIYSTPTTPTQVALGDFNRDGKLDVAIAGQGSNNAIIRLNTGGGVFGTATTLSTGSNTNGIATADFNGDGFLDLAVSRGDSGGVNQGVVIFRGNGNGTFQTGVNTGVGGGTWVQIADLNGDAHPDLVVSNFTTRAVYVQLGRADGTFQPALTTAATGMTGSPWGCAIADLSGDGIPDIVVPLGDVGKVGYRLGIGDGTFGAQTDVTCASRVYAAAVGDLNGNGKIDFVTANHTASSATSVKNTSTYAAGITTQPASANLPLGQSGSLSVQAVNTTSYQWYRNSALLVDGGHFSGATTATLNLINMTPFEIGSFYCRIGNSCNTLNSDAVSVQIAPECSADFNHDGGIDFFDYLDFVDSYSAGC